MPRKIWADASNDDYVIYASANSDTLWLGTFIPPGIYTRVGDKNFLLLSQILLINRLKTRERTLSSCNDWNKFVSSCYTLGCKNCGQYGWTAIKGKKKKFHVWMMDEHVKEKPSEFFKYDDKEFRKNNIILTVYEERKRKRLIVDGLHRAVALTVACQNFESISPVKILECYGKNVNILFPFDVHQIPYK